MTFFDFPRKKNPYRFASLMNLYVAIIMCGGMLLLPSLTWATTLYAKKDGVKVTAEKSPTSAVITTLKLGETVTVLSKAGRLAKVKTSKGKKGWVFTFRLSSKKPRGKSSSGLSGLTGRRKIAARESRAGGSIRGLKESDKQIKQEHRDAVDRMEAFAVTQNDLMQFKKAGHLGEFFGGAQ